MIDTHCHLSNEDYDDIDTHELMEHIKNSGDINFEGQKMYYRNKYKLPETNMSKNSEK